MKVLSKRFVLTAAGLMVAWLASISAGVLAPIGAQVAAGSTPQVSEQIFSALSSFGSGGT